MLLGVVGFAKGSSAATINAESCRQADVQNAVNSAKDGDTVSMPAGTCEWRQNISIGSKSIALLGAGIDKTVITRNYPGTNNDNRWMIYVEPTGPFRVSNFTLQSSLEITQVYGISFVGPSKSWRIDHLKFSGLTGTAISVAGYTFGLIDHIEHLNNSGVGVDVEGTEPGDGDSSGTQSWQRPLGLGTINAIYVEDSVFKHTDNSITSFGEFVASNRGSRYAVRYSTFYDGNPDTYAGPLDAHGQCNQNDRGSRSWEVYENSISWIGNGKAMAVRGGDGVIFNNTLNFTRGSTFHLVDYRSSTELCWECGDPPDPQCGSNINYPADYPMQDQTREAYFWNNTLNGNPLLPEVRTTAYTPLFIQEGRDFFNYARPGYVPLTYPHPFITDCGTYPLLCQDSAAPSPPTGLTVN